MNKLDIAFFGAPTFAARVLEQIINDQALPVELTFVVTQPDRPAGRKQTLTPTPVKLLAQKHGIEVFEDFRLSNFKTLRLKEIDLVLLYAFGELLPPELLKLPRWGFWNIHPSLLPKYRGTSPISYALLMGDKTTGVSLIQMDERMDHGPIISQREYEIQNSDSREMLENKLSDIGYELFKKSVQDLINGTLERRTQNEEQRTFTRLLTKQDGFLPFTLVQKILTGVPLENEELPNIITEYNKKHPSLSTNYYSPTTYYNLFRALSPWPGLWTLLRLKASEGQAPIEKRLKITGMKLSPNGHPQITHVQLEGKKEVDIATFQKAYNIF
jgi:methionyl-tRNA formyltransferase